MGFRHFFDFYTIRIRGKRQQSARILDNFDDAGTNFLTIVSDCMDGIEDFRDDSENETVIIKDSSTIDKSNSAVSGRLKVGAYGASSELINRKNKRLITKVSVDDANVFSLFFYFFIPKKSTTAALIVHRVGGHGMYSQIREAVSRYFRAVAPDFVLDIEPVFFNLKTSKEIKLTKIEVILSEKQSATQKSVTGSRSPRQAPKAQFIIPVGRGPNVLKQLLASGDSSQFVLDMVAPFLQSSALKDHDLTFNAKVKIGNQSKTININKKFSYNTAVDITDELKFVNNQPVPSSLEKLSRDWIQILKDNHKL